MSGFTALNIEYDNVSDEEVDDTKEIQIEEALKLYQTALRFHSEGPRSFKEAAEAYDALFKSDIFKYPEAQSEFSKVEQFGNIPYDDLGIEDLHTGPVILAGPSEGTPNTLLQILHLSFKNHGQFLLERLQTLATDAGTGNSVDEARKSPKAIKAAAKEIIRLFADALDKDDADLDLWRRASAVAALVGSTRAARFCIEAVLDGEDDGLQAITGQIGLEEQYATHRLKQIVQRLEDDLSARQRPLSSFKPSHKALTLLRNLDEPGFAQLKNLAGNDDIQHIAPEAPASRYRLSLSDYTWSGVGEALLQQYHTQSQGVGTTDSGYGIEIVVPSHLSPPIPPTPPAPPPAESNPIEALKHDVITSQTIVANEVGPEKPPTTTPDTPTEKLDVEMSDSAPPGEAIKREPTNEPISLPSRKRSTDSAGLPETADGVRSRSKRIRARDSVADGGNGHELENVDPDQQLAEQLRPYSETDDVLFDVTNRLLEKMKSSSIGDAEQLRQLLKDHPAVPKPGTLNTALHDIQTLAREPTPEIVARLANPPSAETIAETSREAGLNAFLGNAKSGRSNPSDKLRIAAEHGLPNLIQRINGSWLSAMEASWLWLSSLLKPDPQFTAANSSDRCESSYLRHQWPDDLKRAVVQTLVHMDEFIFDRLTTAVLDLERGACKPTATASENRFWRADMDLAELCQTIYELHLDVYTLIRNPGSGVDFSTQSSQKDRLERWAYVANYVVNLVNAPSQKLDDLQIRHIWTAVFHLNVAEGIEQSHIVMCLKDLQETMSSTHDTHIVLQNNAVIPELSKEAAERELSKIQMKDSFLSIFDQNETDPATVIETLEPLLDPLIPGIGGGHDSSHGNIDLFDQAAEMRKFLNNSDLSLKLSLWQRLRDAYEAIDYPTKVVSCYIRSIEAVVEEFKSPRYQDAMPVERQDQLISGVKLIADFLHKALGLSLKTIENPFECFDDQHLRSSTHAVAELCRLFHSFSLFEINQRIGQVSPIGENRPNSPFNKLATVLHDLEVRSWMLFYQLVKEGMIQDKEAFEDSDHLKVEFLRALHDSLGIRYICKASNKALLRMMKDELLDLWQIDTEGETELIQALYDLYDLRCCTSVNDVADHSITDSAAAEPLTRKTATRLLDFVIAQVQKVGLKDIPKMELRSAIEKVQAALGRAKVVDEMVINKKLVQSLLKSPINPLRLYQCLNGVGDIGESRPISAGVWPPAEKGWYFLIGSLAFNKFRSQKRLQGGSTEDLDVAIALFHQDLEFDADRWKTWHRIGQGYDSQLEERVSWTAEKINAGSHEILAYQRQAIHSYTMAVACAVRTADTSPEDISQMAQLYADFGMRIYSSSREPFSMHAFSIRESEQRNFSSQNMTMYKSVPFNPLGLYTAWKYAAALFGKAITLREGQWPYHYMLAKCYWKMYRAPEDVRRNAAAPSWEDVIEQLTIAVNLLPSKSRRDPILEPRYKLLSITHKLLQCKDISLEEACEILNSISYAQKLPQPTEMDDWEPYVLGVLKALRSADKSGWHHRMTLRAAHVIYDDSADDITAAIGVKHELTQAIFTKTMIVNVWKPEHERAGRHFVYTTRYTQFFVRILVQLGDRASLELLSKRVRKKPHEFFQHSKLWQELCVGYLKILRRAGKVPDGHEDTVFKNLSHDEWNVRSARLEQWAHSPDTTSPLLDILRDVIELKKANNGLMKPTLIDDLIGDTYALMYTQIAMKLDISNMAPNAMLSANGHMDGASDLSRAGTPATGGAALNSVAVPIQPSDQTSRSRTKGVGRREVHRKAEAAATRPVAPASASTPSNGSTNGPTPTRASTVQVIIDSNGRSGTASENDGSGQGAAGVKGTDADDDSGSSLSDLEDLEDEPEDGDDGEQEARSMFPGLASKLDEDLQESIAASLGDKEKPPSDTGMEDSREGEEQ
ncbi:hypothetical protein P152DRAFT_458151 [Eremomyces bilateralis CBS 781.70]|uniref:Histone transcription regulator 3 homolog n=1 Tax=Eremomyces bilateralis CBS 781.70 TaxID=1392243 RepID=A0A6G1G4I0_9PEZI|nr:uncharacterized protein P152DRAFT_458151 [Eremomyces bilateralis CBS 781.70]KAF1812977.1 hypothetical protein P152DRAFT_458151 [Eremomyces bilateralis CBS 781.70]